MARRWALALLTPLILTAYSWVPTLAPVAWFALVPWILLYTDDRHPRVSFVYHFVASVAAMPLLYPVIFRFGWHFPIAFSLTFMLPWLLYAPLMRRIHHRLHLPRTLTFPVVWVTVEWARSTWSLAHFDLFRLGTTQAAFTPLIQIADVTGVYGVSFLVAAFNGFLADVYCAAREHGWRAALRRRRIAIAGAAVLVALVGVVIYGFGRLASLRHTEGPRVALVQPNIRHLASNAVGVHLAQVFLTDDLVQPGEADLIVWPENAILDNLRRPGAYLDDLAWLGRRKQAPLLVGSMGKPAKHPGRTTNGAFLVRDGVVLGQYDKQVLFPWSEFVPLDDWLGRVAPGLQALQRTLVRRGWGFLPTGRPGERTLLLRLPWNGFDLPFATLICGENVYPPIAAEAGRAGARFFVTMTSEGEVGGPLQEHLLRTTMLRAVENHIAYVRVGNTGVSCFIDSAGRLQSLLRGQRGGTIFDSGVLVDRVALSTRSGPTLYARSHDAFAKACILATLGLLAATWVRRRPRPVTAAGGAATGVVLLALLVGGCTAAPAIGDDPGGAAAALEQGQRLVAARDAAGALEALARACADPLACRNALPLTAASFRALRAPERAIDFYARIAEQHPELAGVALGYQGEMLDLSLRAREAEAAFERALERTPAPRVYGLLGGLRLRLDDRDGAIAAYREGLRMNPGDLELRYLLGRALRMAAEYDEARKLLESVLADQPDHGQAWTNLGRVQVGLGEREAAERTLLRSIEVDPENIEARYQLVKMALRDDRRDDARRWFGEIRAIESTFDRATPPPE